MSKKTTSNLPMGKPRSAAFRFGFVSDELSFLLGRVLTIIDASISPSIEAERNKAIKDLIKDKFSSEQEYYRNMAHKVPSTGVVPSSREQWEDGLCPDPDESVMYYWQ